MKRSSRQGQSKILLSFRLTRKVDSTIEDSSDTNTDTRSGQKIQFSEDTRKLYNLLDFYAMLYSLNHACLGIM